MSRVRDRVLAGVASSDITYRYRKHRWWLNEREYRLVTPTERKHLMALIEEGLVERVAAAGYSHSLYGYYELTPEGRKRHAETLLKKP